MSLSLLQQANNAFQLREFRKALDLYKSAKSNAGPLTESLNYNIALCIKELMQEGHITALPDEADKPEVERSERPTKTPPPLSSLYEILTHEANLSGRKNSKAAIIIVAVESGQELLKQSWRNLNDTEVDIYVLSTDAFDVTQYDGTRNYFFVPMSEPSQPLVSLCSFLQQEILNKYDYVCVLPDQPHTHAHKSIQTYRDFFYLQIEVLLNAAERIITCFDSNPNLGYVGCADAFKNSKFIDLATRSCLHRTLCKSDQAHLIRSSFGFFSGACMWMRLSTIKESLSSVYTELKRLDLDKSEKIIEPLLGLLPSFTKNDTALVYPLSITNQDSVIILAQNTKIPEGSYYPASASLQSYQKLAGDIVKITNHFSPSFYRNNYPFIAKLKMQSEYHFLRFGANEGFNPNKNFSSSWQSIYVPNTSADDEHSYNSFISYLESTDNGKISFPAQENTPGITKIIDQLSLFDENHYLAINPDVAKSKFTPLNHYVKHGWIEGRSPCKSAIFDSLWYESEYLCNFTSPVNPLLHYAVLGKEKGFLPKPKLRRFEPSSRFKKGQTIRRVCLFAGYDVHGQIDDYVIELITEISRHADVYYLADSEISSEELEKLTDITVDAWAFRHGEYDFGSYSKLAMQLVGWDTIQRYDEVLLVNDSGYLLTGLDAVFEKMSSKKCDWWGLQATKGIAATRHANSNQFQNKIPMTYVLDRMLKDFENDDCYDFLIGSYFIAFRAPTLEKGGALYRLLNSVRKERNKRNIVLKYEVGLTRSLIISGHRPATFIDDLYPFHPIFTENHFKLIKAGFPLFKRYFLTENHYKTPNLLNWKSIISSIVPNANLDTAQRNLDRISNAEKLYRTLNIPADGSTWPVPLLSDEQFEQEDIVTPKDTNLWAFPVCAFDHGFGGNERMVFEAVKNDPKVRKVILYRTKTIDVGGINVVQVPIKSREGQQYLLEAVYIFIKHTPWRNAIYPLNPMLHRFINLWHGIPLKRIGYTSLDMLGKLEASAKEHDKCHAVIASSKIDRLAMAASFYPLTYHDVWTTGLPRNDVILQEESQLPLDFQSQIAKLRRALDGRKLVMYAPTFRNGQDLSVYSFSPDEISALSHCLKSNNAVLGIREHMAAKHDSYWSKLVKTEIPVLDLGRQHFADIELIYREADVLITDYSSCFIDFMLTGKPEICFAYDYDSYATNERGLFYELKDVFPGPICRDASGVIDALHICLAGQKLERDEAYDAKRKTFFDFIDCNNTQRLVDMINHEIAHNLPGRKRVPILRVEGVN